MHGVVGDRDHRQEDAEHDHRGNPPPAGPRHRGEDQHRKVRATQCDDALPSGGHEQVVTEIHQCRLSHRTLRCWSGPARPRIRLPSAQATVPSLGPGRVADQPQPVHPDVVWMARGWSGLASAARRRPHRAGGEVNAAYVRGVPDLPDHRVRPGSIHPAVSRRGSGRLRPRGADTPRRSSRRRWTVRWVEASPRHPAGRSGRRRGHRDEHLLPSPSGRR